MELEEYHRMRSVEESMWWYQGLRAVVTLELARRLGPGPRRLLDAGCGTGATLRHLERTFDGLQTWGVDIAPIAVTETRKQSGARLAVSSINQLPFGDARFDAVISLDVLCHRSVDEQAALREMLRCLKPGGVCLVNLPAYEWLRSRHDEEVHTARRYTQKSAESSLRQAGFAQISSYHWNSLPFPLMVLRRKAMGGWNGGSDVRTYPAVLERMFNALLAAERSLRRRGLPLPFGGSVLAIGVRHG